MVRDWPFSLVLPLLINVLRTKSTKIQTFFVFFHINILCTMKIKESPLFITHGDRSIKWLWRQLCNNVFFFSISCVLHWIVVTQYYEADVNKEHVIRGNSAVIKCLIPSFVADFVEVVSWHSDQDDVYVAGKEYGLWEPFIFYI